jgi:hypothetical protein
MAAKTHSESLPLCRPMYWEHPADEQAYSCPRQYYFGTELIAAPYVSPRDPHTRLSRQVVWLPQGDWYHFLSGERIAGNRWHAAYGPIDDMPVFARAGAIVPMSADGPEAVVANPKHMNVRVFAGADGAITLYEDDGESNHFEEGARCTTTISQVCTANTVTIKVSAPLGDRSSLPSRRAWTFEVVGAAEGCTVKATCGGRVLRAAVRHDTKRGTLVVDLPACAVAEPIAVAVRAARAVIDRTDRFESRVHELILHFDANCNVLDAAYEAMTKHRGSAEALCAAAPGLSSSQMRLLCEVALDAGVEVINDAADACRLVVLWNNGGRKGVRYNLLSGHRQGHNGGAVPRFQRIPYTTFSWGRHDAYIGDWGPWELDLDYGGAHRVRVRGEGHGTAGVA